MGEGPELREYIVTRSYIWVVKAESAEKALDDPAIGRIDFAEYMDEEVEEL